FSGVPGFLNVNTKPFVKIGDGYYFIETGTPRNWFDASEACARLKADLVSFETTQEWVLVNEYLWNKTLNNVYWTSGSDLAKKGTHNWVATGYPIVLNIWSPGEPNNYYGKEDCDILGERRATAINYNTLNDIKCSDKELYICEAPQPKTASFVIW
ncbi:hypothetical protein KR018_005760, partial [Drosophila ironensis]